MLKLRSLLLVSLLASTSGACAGNAYLPGDPGGAQSDLSGQDVREQWVADHPEEGKDISAAVLEGIFLPGMTLAHRNVITNPKRKGSTGNGFWRSRTTGDETRYQWFVASQREPFVDGKGRNVCELVFVGDVLTEVRYCSAEAASSSG